MLQHNTRRCNILEQHFYFTKTHPFAGDPTAKHSKLTYFTINKQMIKNSNLLVATNRALLCIFEFIFKSFRPCIVYYSSSQFGASVEKRLNKFKKYCVTGSYNYSQERYAPFLLPGLFPSRYPMIQHLL